MKKSLFVVVLVTLAALLVACGGDAIVGNWETVYMSEGETSFKAIGMAKFEIKSDGTLIGDAAGSKTEGTWKKEGDKYILTAENSDVEATIEKGLLVLNFEGNSKMYCSKDAKNFKDFPEGIVDMMDMGGDKEEKKDEEK